MLKRKSTARSKAALSAEQAALPSRRKLLSANASGVQTRFAPPIDILNQHARTHLTITHATISEHGGPIATVAESSARVAVSAILIISENRCPTPIRSSYFSKSKVTAAAPRRAACHPRNGAS